MRNFKRAAAVTFACFLCAVLLCLPITEVYFNARYYNYQDSDEREQLAGSLDFLVCGSSQSVRSFVPAVLDEKLGCNSYNTAGLLMTMKGRYTILKKELSRNPVKTVVLELSYNSLSRNRDAEGPEGDIYILGRLDNFAERMAYAVTTLRINEYDRVLYDTLNRGFVSAEKRAKNVPEYTLNSKGYWAIGPKDCTISKDEYDEKYHSVSFDETVDSENLKYIQKITDLCDKNGVRVIVVVTPLSDRFIAQYDNFDTVIANCRTLAAEHGYDFFDFNLLKNKTELFPNTTAFFDDSHLSESGANVFSSLFAELFANNDSMQSRIDLFYSSYADADANGAFGWR